MLGAVVNQRTRSKFTLVSANRVSVAQGHATEAHFHPRHVREKDTHEHAEQLPPRNRQLSRWMWILLCLQRKHLELLIIWKFNKMQKRSKRGRARNDELMDIALSVCCKNSPSSWWQPCCQECLAHTTSNAKILQISSRIYEADNLTCKHH